jgi:hypothetical protein
MSVTMARQGDWVQLKESDMHLASNTGKMANGGVYAYCNQENTATDPETSGGRLRREQATC